MRSIDELIYGENSTKRLHIDVYKDGKFIMDIANYVTSYEEQHYLDVSQSFYIIGLSPSKEIIFSLDNIDEVLGRNLLDYEFKAYFDLEEDLTDNEYNLLTNNQDEILSYYTEYNKTTFKIFENPEKFTRDLSIVGNDKISLLDINYDSKLDYDSDETTIEKQILEMSEIVGLEFDLSTLDDNIRKRKISFYDNTYSIRSYVEQIAEINASNVIVDDNIVKFKKISRTPQYDVPLAYATDLYKGEEFGITGVAFNNADLETYIAGNDSGNVLYLNATNPYINGQNDVDNIYEQLKGLKFVSFEDLHLVKGNPEIKIGDVVNFVNEDGESEFVGFITSNYTKFATGFMTDLSGSVSNEIAEITTNRFGSVDTKVRKITIEVDRNKQSLDILAQETDGLNTKYSELYQDVSGFKQTVKEVKDEVDGVSEKYSEIEQNVNGFKQEVSEKYTTKEEFDDLEIGDRNLYIIANSKSGYLSGNGNVANANATRKEVYSDYIPVTPNETYQFQVWVTPTTGGSEYLWMSYEFYDSEKKYVGSRPAKTGGTIQANGMTYNIYSIVAPINTSYIRISARTYNDGLIKLEKGTKPTGYSRAYEDIDDKFSNYSTTSEMNSIISQTKDNILTEVSSNYTTKKEFNNLEVGGTNLLKYTDYQTLDGVFVRGSYGTASVDTTDKLNGNNSLKFVTTQVSSSGNRDIYAYLWETPIVNKNLIVSFYIKGSVNAKMWIRGAGTFTTSKGITNTTGSTAINITTSWTKVAFDLGIVSLSINTTSLYCLIYGFSVAGTFYINSMKLEYGTKATDWSPAPQDLLSQIGEVDAKFVSYSTTEQMNSAISQSRDSILSTVSGTYATQTQLQTVDGKFANYSTTTQMNTAIEQTQSSIINKVSNEYTTKTEFGNLQIGGTNLLKYTDYTSLTGVYNRGTYHTVSIDTSNKYNGRNSLKIVCNTPSISGSQDVYQMLWNTPINGENVIVSFWIKGSVNAKMWIRGGGAFSTSLGLGSATSANAISITTSWQRVVLDLKTVSLTGSTQSELIYGFGTAGTYYINSMKLEYGTKATDWSPAPEDIENEVSNVESRVTSAEQKLTATQWSLWFTEVVNGSTATSNSFTMDKNGLHIKGAGFDITPSNSTTKTLSADTSGNLSLTGSLYIGNSSSSSTANNSIYLMGGTSTFNRLINGVNRTGLKFAIGGNFGISNSGVLYTNDGVFSGTITGSTITGSDINVDSNISVGNNIYIGTQSDSDINDKTIYFSPNNYITRVYGNYGGSTAMGLGMYSNKWWNASVLPTGATTNDEVSNDITITPDSLTLGVDYKSGSYWNVNYISINKEEILLSAEGKEVYSDTHIRLDQTKYIKGGSGEYLIGCSSNDNVVIGNSSNIGNTNIYAGTSNSGRSINLIAGNADGRVNVYKQDNVLSKSNTGFLFLIKNATNSTYESQSANVLFAAGFDSTSQYLVSYATYRRTYTNTVNMVITSNGVFGRYNSSSLRYKYDVNYFTNKEHKAIDKDYVTLSMKSKIRLLNNMSEDEFLDDMYSVLKFPVVEYKYIDGYICDDDEYAHRLEEDKYKAGFIVEDLAEINPRVVQFDENGIPEMWNVNDVVVRTLFVVQEQQKEINLLKKENEELKNKVSNLEEKLNAIINAFNINL